MIQAVIFDMDGVLIDTEKHLVRFWCEAARELGYDMKREHALHIRSLAGKYAAPYLKHAVDENFDYEKVRERRKQRMEEELFRCGIEKKPEVDFLFDELRKRNIKIAVATATDEARATRYLKQIDIYDKIDQLICATMVENGKPMPDVYLYACERIGERPEDCLAIEDSPNGVLSATRAGIRTIMVPDLTRPEEEIKKRLFGVCETLGEVLKYILI